MSIIAADRSYANMGDDDGASTGGGGAGCGI